MSGFILNWKTYQCLFIPQWNYKPQKPSKLLASDTKANNLIIRSFQKTNLRLTIFRFVPFLLCIILQQLPCDASICASIGPKFPFLSYQSIIPIGKVAQQFFLLHHAQMFLFLTLIASSLPTLRGQMDSEFSYTTIRIQHWILSLQGYPEISRVLLQSKTFGFQNHTIEVGDTRFFGSIPIPSSLGISISMVENTHLLSYCACMSVINTLSNE